VGDVLKPGLEGLAGDGDRRNEPGRHGTHKAGSVAASGAWSDFDILPCLDGKARRVESGTFPLVNGLPRGMVPSGDPSLSYVQATAEGRVMRLRGYGNAIVPELAAEFIAAYRDVAGLMTETQK
jgi:DNA (cytosine-5)-methyltransferase 1